MKTLIAIFAFVLFWGFENSTAQTTTKCFDSTMTTSTSLDTIISVFPATGSYANKHQWGFHLTITRTSGTLTDTVFIQHQSPNDYSWHTSDTLIVTAANPVEFEYSGEALSGKHRMYAKAPSSTQVAHFKGCWNKWDSRE